MVFCPLMISSENPFSSPSFAERFLNSGRTLLVIYLVRKMEAGMVITNTDTSTGAIISIIIREPATVITLVQICRRSLDREPFTVSIS